MGKDNPERRETRRQSAIRSAHKDDGRYVRTKEARGGFGHICDCEWCLGNWLRQTRKEISRINDEEKDFIQMGCPPDWGYDWADPWGYYDYDTYFDPEEDWWWEWLNAKGVSRRDFREQYWKNYFEDNYDHRMSSPRETFCLAEVL